LAWRDIGSYLDFYRPQILAGFPEERIAAGRPYYTSSCLLLLFDTKCCPCCSQMITLELTKESQNFIIGEESRARIYNLGR
jgi:hypothetical protein